MLIIKNGNKTPNGNTMMIIVIIIIIIHRSVRGPLTAPMVWFLS